VINELTVRDAAADDSALRFPVVGVAIVLPFILGYTIYSYLLFRGKVEHGMYDH